MSKPCKSSGLPVIVVAMLLLLPFVYMATYYVMLTDQISLASPPAMGVPYDLKLEPVYRWDHPVVEKVMEPAHRIDKIIRSSYWH